MTLSRIAPVFSRCLCTSSTRWGKISHLRGTETVVKKVTGQKTRTPEAFKKYDEEFARVAAFQNQLQGVREKGFRRPYTAYEPPANMEERFTAACGRILSEDAMRGSMANVDLEKDLLTKAKLLNELSKEFG